MTPLVCTLTKKNKENYQSGKDISMPNLKAQKENSPPPQKKNPSK